jgi:hypothetical protein
MAGWAEDREDAKSKTVALASLALHIATDLVAFGAYWAALVGVEWIKHKWPLQGWAGLWLGHVHQAGVLACALWITVIMFAEVARTVSGRKPGGKE